MALNLTDNWQIAKILTDNWHLYTPIQTLISLTKSRSAQSSGLDLSIYDQ